MSPFERRNVEDNAALERFREFSAKNAEIERLHELEAQTGDLIESLNKQHGEEIERLKAIVENQKKALNRRAEAGSNYEALIGELVDMLEKSKLIRTFNWMDRQRNHLIGRAKEAINAD